MGSKASTHSDCPLPPGSRVAGYFRDSGGDEQESSVDQQRRVAEEYCQQHHLVLVRVFADVALSWPKDVIRAESSQYLFRVIPVVDQMPPVSPR